jgi:hypothetical protein
MSPVSDADRVSDLLLERYRLGEVDGLERERVDRLLAGDASLRLRLEQLARSDAEIDRSYPPVWRAERVRERLRRAGAAGASRRAPARAPRWLVPAGVAAAAAVVLVLAPRIAGPPPSGPDVPQVEPGDRIKGMKPSLQLFRRTPDGSETLADGAVVRAGDVVRVGYRAAGRGFGVIVSIDGRGAVTLHLPAGGDQAAPLESGDTVLLDRAYELDDAPRFERFYLVTAAAPFPVAPVLNAARRAAEAHAPADLHLAEPLEQTTFLVWKGGRP